MHRKLQRLPSASDSSRIQNTFVDFYAQDITPKKFLLLLFKMGFTALGWCIGIYVKFIIWIGGKIKTNKQKMEIITKYLVGRISFRQGQSCFVLIYDTYEYKLGHLQQVTSFN